MIPTSQQTAHPERTLLFTEPLVKHIYTADPSAHVFNGKIYIYPSHDVDAGEAFDDLGSHFCMEDYHVFSMENVDDPAAQDHGVALHVNDVPWASKQMWAPDATEKNGLFYLFFPAKDHAGIFRIGVAVSAQPTGPFQPDPEPIAGTYSIDPAVFADEDGAYYLYFGGIWGGQLQRWNNNRFCADEPASPVAFLPEQDQPALGPRVAKLSDDLRSLAEPVQIITILDEKGQPLLQGDVNRRFFEASWMHKYQGKYYFSYSTGDSHFICYAIGNTPYGPFTYAGRILDPVEGWTTHHSIVQIEDKWYLFYHDAYESGKTHLRQMKVTELQYDDDGYIKPLTPNYPKQEEAKSS